MGRTGESEEGSVSCLHLLIKSWEEDKTLLYQSVVKPGVKVTYGGWKCTECGMKFLPRNMVEEMIRQMMENKK